MPADPRTPPSAEAAPRARGGRTGALIAGRPTGLLAQFARYVVVGGGAFIVDFGTLAALNKGLGVHYLAAAATGFIAGLFANYLVSVRWVFDQRKVARRSVEFAIFAVVGAVGLAINHGVIWGLTGGLGVDPLLSKLVSAAIVLCWNFGARKVALF